MKSLADIRLELKDKRKVEQYIIMKKTLEEWEKEIECTHWKSELEQDFYKVANDVFEELLKENIDVLKRLKER